MGCCGLLLSEPGRLFTQDGLHHGVTVGFGPVLQREAPDTRSLGFLPEEARAEIEAKYLIEDAAQVTALTDALQSHDVQSVSAVDVVDSYWDTPGWHLFNAGWAYRWRDASR